MFPFAVTGEIDYRIYEGGVYTLYTHRKRERESTRENIHTQATLLGESQSGTHTGNASTVEGRDRPHCAPRRSLDPAVGQAYLISEMTDLTEMTDRRTVVAGSEYGLQTLSRG